MSLYVCVCMYMWGWVGGGEVVCAVNRQKELPVIMTLRMVEGGLTC